MSAIAVSPYSSDHLYVATDLGVFATRDGSNNWFEFNDGLPLAYCSDIHYHPLDRTLRIATLGRGAWKTKAMDAIENSVVNNSSNDPPGGFKLFQNFPNPFNPSTTILYALGRQSHIVISVHNQLGQEICQVADIVQSAGIHVAKWDGTNSYGMPAASGTYYIKVSGNGFSQTRKAVLIR